MTTSDSNATSYPTPDHIAAHKRLWYKNKSFSRSLSQGRFWPFRSHRSRAGSKLFSCKTLYQNTLGVTTQVRPRRVSGLVQQSAAANGSRLSCRLLPPPSLVQPPNQP